MESQYWDEPMMRDLRFPNMKDSKIFIFCLCCFLIVAMILKITVCFLKQGYNRDLLKHLHMGGGIIQVIQVIQVFVFWSCSFKHRWKMCNAVVGLVRVSCRAWEYQDVLIFLCWIWPFSIFFIFCGRELCLHELVFPHHLCVLECACVCMRVC